MVILASIGVVTVLLCIVLTIMVIGECAQHAIDRIKLKHYQKHRFDKPPTAKCYCIDCVQHAKDGRCRKFDGWYTGDAWFCWDAEPCTSKEYEKKGD